jgi:hypothetical protein
VNSKELLAADCNTIEGAYELMLAYAAQGLRGDAESHSGGQLREFLSRASTAVSKLPGLFAAIIQEENLQHPEPYRAFHLVLERDATNTLAAMQIVLAQSSISSQLVDNLNASIHLRALLTDLFLIDEILKKLP